MIFICIRVQGALLVGNAETEDQGWRSDGSSVWIGQTNNRIGTETGGQITGYVLPFKLPPLSVGEQITNAVLNIFSESQAYLDGTANLDLRGVRTSAVPTTQFSDISGGTLLVDNAYVLTNSIPVNQMLSLASSNMTAYLQNVYESDPYAAGQYLLLAVVPDATNSISTRYLTVSTANNSVGEQHPSLHIYTTGGSTQELSSASVVQHGIQWVFDSEYPVGQYANGDYWVVGPVTITSIETSLHTVPIGTNTIDGSMINPVGSSTQQGYDSRLNSYSADLNCGRPGRIPLSAENPLILPIDCSLVSSVSWTTNEPGCPPIAQSPAVGPDRFNVPRPTTRSMAILTCVSNAPPSGAFRPPYCGSNKSARLNKSQLDCLKLGRLPPVATTPSLASEEANFAGPWVDHVRSWLAEYNHPSMHMPSYGRDLSTTIGQGALMLQLDFNQLPGSPSKEKLLVEYVQLGIDLAGVADTGGHWPSDGGIFQGRKWPILFAGVMLDDAHMKNVGNWSTQFHEDQDTFYISQTEVDITHSAAWNPDTRADELWPYEAESIGLPEWGIRHETEPNRDNLHWSATYRIINNQSYPGWVLAAHIMGQKAAWNHDALFDYIDRSTSIVDPYNNPEISDYQNAVYVYGNHFIRSMWQTYRADYPPQWVPNDPSDVYGHGSLASPRSGLSFSLRAVTD